MSGMKDSGIEWVGLIPNDWEVKRLRDFANIMRGTIDKNVDEREIPVKLIQYTNIYKRREQKLDFNDYLDITVTKNELFRGSVKPGDILVTASSETIDDIGHSTVIMDEMPNHVFGADIVRIRIPPTMMDLSYRKYILENYVYLSKFSRMSRGVTRYRFSMNDFSNQYYPIPPIKEQRQISSTLDRISSTINSSIVNIKKHIELLEEYKKSIITEAVTKGLDPNVSMKDSGIEWIGFIPEEWEIIQLKKVTTKIGSGKTPRGGANIYSTSGVLFIRSQNVLDVGLEITDACYISEEIDEDMSNTRVAHGDVLLNITGASIGRACVYSSNDRANVNQHVCIIRPDTGLLSSRYLHYCLTSHVGSNIVDSYQTKSNREALTFEQIGMSKIPIPPMETQNEICDFIDEICFKVVTSTNLIREQVKLLEEYKKSIIFEYVTGKKQVEVEA